MFSNFKQKKSTPDWLKETACTHEDKCLTTVMKFLEHMGYFKADGKVVHNRDRVKKSIEDMTNQPKLLKQQVKLYFNKQDKGQVKL